MQGNRALWCYSVQRSYASEREASIGHGCVPAKDCLNCWPSCYTALFRREFRRPFLRRQSLIYCTCLFRWTRFCLSPNILLLLFLDLPPIWWLFWTPWSFRTTSISLKIHLLLSRFPIWFAREGIQISTWTGVSLLWIFRSYVHALFLQSDSSYDSGPLRHGYDQDPLYLGKFRQNCSLIINFFSCHASYIAKSRSISANMLRSPCEDVAGVNFLHPGICQLIWSSSWCAAYMFSDLVQHRRKFTRQELPNGFD